MQNDEWTKESGMLARNSFIIHHSAFCLRTALVVAVIGQASIALTQQPVMGLRPPVVPFNAPLQAVEFIGPPGTRIGLAMNGAFLDPLPMPIVAALQVRPIYRLRVTNLANEEDREIYPTVELIDHLCPPPGQELRFPIPIELTEEDLHLALAGHFITRVIYVEDPQTANPVVQDASHPNWYDVGPGLDALNEAKHWGRPVAIVRLGGRVPDNGGPDMEFLLGCPPLAIYGPPRRRAPTTPPPAAAPQPNQEPAAIQPVAPVAQPQEAPAT
jgi:hypothetical protein